MIELLIVNHHTAAETAGLLARLPAGFAPRVLENGSGPNDVAALAQAGCVVEVSEVNLGFAAGANRLAAGATAPWLLFVNPDLEPDPELFARVLARLPTDPLVAVVGGVRAGEGPRTWGRFPGLLDRFRAVEAAPEAPRAVDWVSGCFMLVRRAAFSELGGFDEGYFMQLEDVDLCWRARRRGWQVRVDPAFTFAHRGHLSYLRSRRKLAADVRAGKVRFLSRSGRPFAAAALRAVHAVLRLNPAAST